MAYVDPMVMRQRMMQAAMPQRNGRIVTYNPAARTREIRQQAAQSPRKQQLAEIIGTPSGARKPQGGGRGVLGSVLNNPIGKATMGALGALDVPRRVVISGLQEYVDAVSGNGDASFGDFIDQTRDEQFGFGSVIGDATGNKWLDRGLGFLGDVALDPMTYLTFGAGKFAGQAGRIAAGTRVAEAGMDARKVSRLGVLGANAAERDVIFAGMKNADELAQPGLRFMGARLPGTERLAEGVGTGLAKTRAAIGDTRLGGVARRVRAPEGFEDQFGRLARGQGNTADDLGYIARGQTAAGTSGMFAARYANDADRLTHDIRKGSDGQAIFHALEMEDLDSVPMARETRALLDDVFGEGSKFVPEFQHREGFAPHVMTDEFFEATRGDEFAEIRQAVGVDPTQATGGVLKRHIEPGGKLTLPDGQVIEWVADTPNGAVSARQINEKFGAALGVSKAVEDDITKALQPYIEGISHSVGRAEGLRRLAGIADTGGFVDTIDNDLTNVKRQGLKDGVEASRKAVSGERAAVAGELDKGIAFAQKSLTPQFEQQVGAAKAELAAARAGEKRGANVAGALGREHGKVTAQADASVSAAQRQLDDIAGEQRLLLEGEVSERADIATAKRQGKLEHDATVKRAKRAQARGEATVVPSGSIPSTEAAAEASESVTKRVARQQADIDARRDAAIGSMAQAERTAAKSYDDIDGARAAARSSQMDSKTRIAQAQRDVKVAKKNLAAVKRIRTPKGSDAAVYAKIETDLDAAVKAAGTYEGSDDVAALMSWYTRGVSELRDGAAMNQALRRMEGELRNKDIVPVMKKVIQDGYEQIGTTLLGEEGPIVRKELARQLANLETAMSQPGPFLKVIDGYTKFFKSYATATVGFHVRNGFSAAFMNATDGVSVRNMGRGAKLWSKFGNDPKGFLDNLPSWIDRDQAENAMKAVWASGGGEGQFGKAEIRLGKNWLTNNPYTRFSQRLGGEVEGFVRMGMAIDTILDGGTLEQAAARITRIHFDYSQVSKMDRTMKRIIPFWTFMSRNAPLQIQQMFLKPRMYQAYKSLARNMGQDYEGGMVPKSWQESGSFEVTPGVHLAPDLPHVRLKDELNKLTSDPQRLLADANPLAKVPLETLAAKRRFYNDQPFVENDFSELNGGLQVLAPVLEQLGLTETAGDGSTVVDERVAYALRGLFPPLGQSQRLIGDDGGGNLPGYYEDKKWQSRLNNVGVPIRLLTPRQRAQEEARRTREARSDPDELRRKALLAYRSG